MSDDESTTSLVEGHLRDPTPPRAPVLVSLVEGSPALHWLRARETVVGRDPECDVCLDVRGVSRMHAKLVMSSPEHVTLFDLRARNGTFVNGRRVEDLVLLRDDDEIHLGPLAALRFTRRLVTGSTTGVASALETLTAREREIAGEVAQGLTNAAIATKLGLKSRTVASHLEHIYAKLDIRSRADLVRIVVESRPPNR